MITRRGTLAALSTSVVAGCTGGESPQHAADAWQSQRHEELPTGYRQTGTASLDAQEFTALTFSGQVTFVLNYAFAVAEGGAIDVIVIDRPEFDRLRDGKDVSHYRELASLDTTRNEVAKRLTAGDYALVIDNSSFGEATPSGSVAVEITHEVRLR